MRSFGELSFHITLYVVCFHIFILDVSNHTTGYILSQNHRAYFKNPFSHESRSNTLIKAVADLFMLRYIYVRGSQIRLITNVAAICASFCWISGIYNMPKTWLLSDMYFGICIIGSS